MDFDLWMLGNDYKKLYQASINYKFQASFTPKAPYLTSQQTKYNAIISTFSFFHFTKAAATLANNYFAVEK